MIQHHPQYLPTIDDNNIRRFNRATRVKTFGQTYAADFTPGSRATTLFLELDPVVVELTDAAVGQLRTPVGKPELIAALSADFVQDLRADRDALDACNSGKHSDNLEGVQSTSAIDTLLSRAQAIITRLDAAIQNKYNRDPDKLAAKKTAVPVTPPPVA